MSIASRITSIEGHISDIYDSVELTGVDTTDIDKNLVNVPNTLKEGYIDIINNGTDTLYNNFPKVSGEGTSLTLNNTYQAPMRNNLKGNTSQTGTPTPTSPIPVNVVSGDNSIEICRKNLLEAKYKENVASLVVGSNLTNTKIDLNLTTTIGKTYLTLGGYFMAGTYTLSNQGTNYISFNRVAIAGTNCVASSLHLRNSYTWTQNVDGYTYFGIEGDAGETSYGDTPLTENLKLMVNKDTTPLTYEPYIGNTYPINLPVENLLDANNVEFTPSGINWYGLNGSALNNPSQITNTSIGVQVKANKTYTFSIDSKSNVARIQLVYVSGTSFATFGSTITTDTFRTFTPTTDTIVYPRVEPTTSGTKLTCKFQIEEGSKANTYVPYGTTPIELCKIGTYQDQFKKATGKNLAPINLESETYNSLQITNNNNGTFTLYGNPTGSFGRDIATNLTLKAGTYTISANAMPSGLYIALDNEADTQLSNGTLSKTFTLASDTTYTSLGIWFTKNKDYDVTIKLQIEEGSSVTEWQPKEGWYKEQQVRKTILNQNTTLNYNGTAGKFYTTNQTIAPNYMSETSMLSDYLLYSSTTWVANCFGITSTNTFWLYIENGATSLADLQTWLGTHNITLYYILATPTNDPIPSSLINQIEQFYQAQSKNNQTNISQINNDLGFIISASALKKGV